MKKIILIAIAAFGLWYFLKKKAGSEAKESEQTDKSKLSSESLSNSGYLLENLPDKSITDPHSTAIDNISLLIPAEISTLTAEQIKANKDISDLIAGKTWEEGMFSPYGYALTPTQEAWFLNKYLPMADAVGMKTVYSNLIHKGEYSQAWFYWATQIEDQIIALISNGMVTQGYVNPFYVNGIQQTELPAIIPDPLKNYKRAFRHVEDPNSLYATEPIPGGEFFTIK